MCKEIQTGFSFLYRVMIDSNRSMQHLISNTGEEDVEDKAAAG